MEKVELQRSLMPMLPGEGKHGTARKLRPGCCGDREGGQSLSPSGTAMPGSFDRCFANRPKSATARSDDELAAHG